VYTFRLARLVSCPRRDWVSTELSNGELLKCHLYNFDRLAKDGRKDIGNIKKT
jgi:hypothetical protein